jgi:hypothetical protein
MVFALALGLAPLGAPAAGLGELRVSLLDGDVQVKTQESGEWAPAIVNMPVASGDRLWVPARGRLELQLRDGSYLRLDEQSALEILTLERDSYQFYLTTGRAYVNFKGRRDYFLQLDTPIAALRAYDTAAFHVEVAGDGDSRVTVIKGAVEAENRWDRKRLTAGKTLRLRDDARPEVVVAAPPDEWERWNLNRDNYLYGRRESARYLPDELESYAPDFDEQGRWIDTSDYGYVWIPSAYISVGWAPYRNGRWVWIGGDYVWIGYEPWGWAPYHYGRWAFDARHGWCWVPPRRGAVYWGPGYVGWTHTHPYIGWVPLAPGEIYYGYGNFGPHSVNLLHADIRKTVVTHSYKNIQVGGGVTVWHRDTFLTGRPVDVRLKENPFLTHPPHPGRPEIKPERATLRPIVREIPREQLPPAGIRDLPVRELKESRPLVRDRSVPVFKGEARERSAPAVIQKPPEQRPAAGEPKPARPFEIPPADGGKPHEPKTFAPQPERELRPAPVERRPEAARELPRPKEVPRAVEPAPPPSVIPPRQWQAPPQKPPPTPTEKRLVAPERPPEFKKPPEAPAGESAQRKAAPVQAPKKEGSARDDQERANEGVKIR